MGTRRVQAPEAPYPQPTPRYSQLNESQFRQTVLRAFQDANFYLTSKTGTPAALASGDIDDLDIGDSDFLRLSGDAGVSDITGIAGGYKGRSIDIVNLTNSITLQHEDTASVATNRIITATGAAITLAVNDMAELLYDEVSARWRVKGTAV